MLQPFFLTTVSDALTGYSNQCSAASPLAALAAYAYRFLVRTADAVLQSTLGGMTLACSTEARPCETQVQWSP